MTIADKIKRAKADYDAVYEAGKQEGGGGDTEAAYNEGVEAGKKAERNAFWETNQQGGQRTNYQYAYAFVYTDETYNPIYPIVCGDESAYTATGLLTNSMITDTKVPITINGTRADTMFQDCLDLQTVRLLTCINVIRFNNTFRNCRSLVNIIMSGEVGEDTDFSACPLSADSFRSFFDVLSLTTTDKTVTFNKTAKETAFTADEWATLVATRSNWTIALK